MSAQEILDCESSSGSLAARLNRALTILTDTNMTLDQQIVMLLEMVCECEELQTLMDEISARLSDEIEKFKKGIAAAGPGPKLNWANIQAMVQDDDTRKVLFILVVIILACFGGGATIYCNWTYLGSIVEAFIVNVSTIPSLTANLSHFRPVITHMSTSPAFAAIWQKFQTGETVNMANLWSLDHNSFRLAFQLAPILFGIAPGASRI